MSIGGLRPEMRSAITRPVPAAMVRRAGRHHAQLLVESGDRALLQRFLAGWLPQLEHLESARGLRWALDVDPLEVF